ncbi:MAG: hypothetical protein A2Y93_11025 [Chloroflexi bacterium RBG_13_68_17]|nr:MAG: hypothetical protein A2Y93_11025 [Chloroflexi bacterium RBG_13_68_17]
MKKLALLALAMVISACGSAPTPEPTPTLWVCTHDEYLSLIDPITRAWDDAVAVANATPSMALSGPIAALQDLARQMEDLDVGPCADVHQRLVDYERHTIDAYLAFMAGGYDTAWGRAMSEGSIALAEWMTGLNALGQQSTASPTQGQ